MCYYTITSGDREKDPPVPIPNTEVKLLIVENTCLVTSREDRTLLVNHQTNRMRLVFCFIFYRFPARREKPTRTRSVRGRSDFFKKSKNTAG